MHTIPTPFPSEGTIVVASSPALQQVAALCWRTGTKGRRVLLVRSSRGRWILPKGWPIDGMTDAQAAKLEAWEEAGVKKGKISKAPIGYYSAEKRFDGGEVAPCIIDVYELAVSEMTKNYPERGARDRCWVSFKKARKLVQERGLKDILRRF